MQYDSFLGFLGSEYTPKNRLMRLARSAQTRGYFILFLLAFISAPHPGCERDKHSSMDPAFQKGSDLTKKGNRTFSADKVLLIVVDTLRTDRLGCYGNTQQITPNMDRLAKRGIVFERFYTASPWTLPSFGSILSGFSPSIHHAGIPPEFRPKKDRSGVAPLNAGIRTLPQMLPGIHSYAIVNNVNLHQRFGMAKGFQEYMYKKAGFSGYETANRVTNRTWQLLTRIQDQRFFTMVHYFDPHAPYRPPKAFETRFAAGEKGTIENNSFEHFKTLHSHAYKATQKETAYMKGLYTGEVAFVDREIGRLIKRIENHPILRNTWIILTSDHGEEFYEHGTFEHGHTYENEVTMVPLIIAPPSSNQLRNLRIHKPARHIDIAPTILDLFGQTPPYPLEGVSVKPLIFNEEQTNRRCFMEYNSRMTQRRSIFDGHYKIVEGVSDPKIRFVYDLHKDPKEQRRITKHAHLIDKMKSKLMNYVQRFDEENLPRFKIPKSTDLPEDAKKALRSLGYIE